MNLISSLAPGPGKEVAFWVCFSLWLAWISSSDHAFPAQSAFLNAASHLPPQPLTSAQSSGLKAPPLSLHTPLSLSYDPVVTSCRHIASSCQPGITPRKAALGLSYFISLPNLTLTLTDKDKREAKRQGLTSIIQGPPNSSLGSRIMPAWHMNLHLLEWKWREASGIDMWRSHLPNQRAPVSRLGAPRVQFPERREKNLGVRGE